MNPEAKLTSREEQIAELIAWGFAKKEIAAAMMRSEKTIDNTTQSIYRKADVQSSSQLSAWHFCTKHRISFERHSELRKIFEVQRSSRRKQ